MPYRIAGASEPSTIDVLRLLHAFSAEHEPAVRLVFLGPDGARLAREQRLKPPVREGNDQWCQGGVGRFRAGSLDVDQVVCGERGRERNEAVTESGAAGADPSGAIHGIHANMGRRMNEVKSMERNDEPRLAVLIDADNTAAKWADAIFEEIATLGEASVRRIYGDFSGPHLRSWEKKLAGLAVVPHQQFSYTKGKNSPDIALVIDAMDLMHTGRFDGFVLVSSDSDFTRLASSIREPTDARSSLT